MKEGIRDLLIDELHDMLSAEDQIVKALPEMAAAAESSELKEAFQSHLKETKGQVKRLEQVFKLLKVAKKEKFCKATHGLIQEGKEAIEDYKKSPLRDAALISKAQRIEHYEISAYGTLIAFAKELALKDVARLLKETLDEESNADKKLSKISVGGLFSSGVLQQANHEDDDEETTQKSSKNNAGLLTKAKKVVKKAVSDTENLISSKKPHSGHKTLKSRSKTGVKSAIGHVKKGVNASVATAKKGVKASVAGVKNGVKAVTGKAKTDVHAKTSHSKDKAAKHSPVSAAHKASKKTLSHSKKSPSKSKSAHAKSTKH